MLSTQNTAGAGDVMHSYIMYAFADYVGIVSKV